MPSEAVRATKKQHLAQLPGMGIRKGQSEPSIRDNALQKRSTLLRIDASCMLFPVIFGTNTFNLKFSRTIQTGGHNGLFTSCIV
jgi:hypothetical protein